jgi:hypothetical protein
MGVRARNARPCFGSREGAQSAFTLQYFLYNVLYLLLIYRLYIEQALT